MKVIKATGLVLVEITTTANPALYGSRITLPAETAIAQIKAGTVRLAAVPDGIETDDYVPQSGDITAPPAPEPASVRVNVEPERKQKRQQPADE